MKILMVGFIDFRNSDASAIHFSEIANSFIKLKNEVSVLIPNENASLFLKKEINIYTLCKEYKDTIFNALKYNLLAIFKLKSILKNNNFDFIYIRWRLLPGGLIKLLCSKNCKIISEHNGWINLEIKIQRNNNFFAFLGKYLQILDAKYVDKIISVTDGIKEKLIQNKIKENKITTIGNGTNINHFFPFERKERIKLKNELLKTNNIVLGFIGNIAKWQGIDDLIDIFLKIEKKMNIIVLLIGDGLYKKELKNKIVKMKLENHIIFKKNISYKQINKYMNIIDIAFAPKSFLLNEIGYSPLKIRDYAASGKIVVSTAVKGIVELEKYGWLLTYEPKQIDKILPKITTLINDENKRKEMEEKAVTYAKENFSWDVIAQKIIKI